MAECFDLIYAIGLSLSAKNLATHSGKGSHQSSEPRLPARNGSTSYLAKQRRRAICSQHR
jgi:hypothetical protein